MKKADIIHGWDGYPEEGCFPWLKKQLEANGFQVEVPEMPDTDNPKIDVWIPHLQKIIQNPDKDTYLIGHSIGTQTIMRYVETLPENTKLGGIVFLAGFIHLLDTAYEDEEDREIAKPWLETPINWEKIKQTTNNITAIFSDNDECVPLSDKDIFKEKLNAEIIIEHNKGHFSEDSGIKELPSLLNAVLEMAK